MKTNYRGIDYGLGRSNVDQSTAIRYGVINQNDIGQSWYDSAEANYGKPSEPVECPQCEAQNKAPDAWGDTIECECGERFEVELPDCAEPLSFYVDEPDLQAECGECGDIFVMQSKYFTRAQFCSPCAPGACYLLNPCDDGERAYCFGHDWFESGVAPYPVYSVESGELVTPTP